jgi:hypothetical protein
MAELKNAGRSLSRCSIRAPELFKRPKGYFAGKLISDCGLKGTECGKQRFRKNMPDSL